MPSLVIASDQCSKFSSSGHLSWNMVQDDVWFNFSETQTAISPCVHFFTCTNTVTYEKNHRLDLLLYLEEEMPIEETNDLHIFFIYSGKGNLH